MILTPLKIIAFALHLLLATPQVSSGQIAVVVNPENPIDHLESQELERSFLGKTSVFSEGDQVQLCVHQNLREEFYAQALEMSPNQVRRHWIKAVFSGKRSKPPEPLKEAADVRAFVAENKGALAIISFAKIDSTVKVLTIDGMLPGQPGYPLAAKE